MRCSPWRSRLCCASAQIIGLTVADIHTGVGGHVHCLSKGRKERRTPLRPATVAVVNGWIDEHGGPADAALFATITGRPLSRDAIERGIRHTATTAAASCPSLTGKRVTTHTLRHYVKGLSLKRCFRPDAPDLGLAGKVP
ncbi:tyrosine-type recombinase/integrase [Cryobacterium sp. Hh7]|uniref:tyrosine-type recombinase/integrase n=1 Tax=Cryobacterium sp. Hh7 TaxID=1259159 RepID=UPI00351A2E46